MKTVFNPGKDRFPGINGFYDRGFEFGAFGQFTVVISREAEKEVYRVIVPETLVIAVANQPLHFGRLPVVTAADAAGSRNCLKQVEPSRLPHRERIIAMDAAADTNFMMFARRSHAGGFTAGFKEYDCGCKTVDEIQAAVCTGRTERDVKIECIFNFIRSFLPIFT